MNENVFICKDIFFWICAGTLNATESEYEPVSDYELEGAVSDYEARSEFDDTDDWEKDKSMSKRSARVWLHNMLIYYLYINCIYLQIKSGRLKTKGFKGFMRPNYLTESNLKFKLGRNKLLS